MEKISALLRYLDVRWEFILYLQYSLHRDCIQVNRMEIESSTGQIFRQMHFATLVAAVHLYGNSLGMLALLLIHSCSASTAPELQLACVFAHS